MESYKLNENNFILYKKDGSIQNGGFSLDSFSKNQKAGSNPDFFDSTYVIPSGLFHSEKKVNSMHKSNKETKHENTSVIPDELYEKLIDMASIKDNKKSNKNESFKKKKYTSKLHHKTKNTTAKKKCYDIS